MSTAGDLSGALKSYMSGFHTVVPWSKEDRIRLLDFTAANTELTDEILKNNELFSEYINQKLSEAACRYGIGGYNEHRTIYSRSPLFSEEKGEEPRRLHLGTDIWGPAGTPVYAPLESEVHSTGFHDNFGNYGAVIVLQHKLKDFTFHTIYGHLSKASVETKSIGQRIEKGELIATFGTPEENGHWPPHLHFQIIQDMEGNKGDYPGVCKLSERDKYLANCPDPDLILNMTKYATPSEVFSKP